MIHTIQGRWVLAVMAGLGFGAGLATADGPPPIYTQSPSLRLPVQLDERSKAEVSAVKLYVRGPDGRWECVQTATAAQSAFDYRAPGDGEYRFTFVTVDRRGAASPANVEAVPAHRVVVVDQTAPDVTVQPITIRGEKYLQCQIRDANPDLGSIRVVYLAPDNTWQPLLTAGTDAPNLFRVPAPTVFESKIQVTAADRAGNRTTREIDLGDPTTSPVVPGKPVVDRGKPDPTMLPKDGDPLIPTAGQPDRGLNGPAYAELPKAPRADLPPLPDLPPVMPPGKPGDAAPDIKLPDPPGGRIQEPPAVVPAGDPYRSPSPLGKVEPGVRLPAGLPELPEVKPLPDLPPPPSVPGVGATSSSMKPSAPASAQDQPRPEGPGTGAGRNTPPILNTRTVTINYQLEGSDPLAGRIDFWATQDGGRTWSPLRDASSGVPPARLTLPADGVFGIRIRPGGGIKPPEPGEEPDCVVEVDSTKPVVTLLPPSIGPDGSTMVLSWTAADANLLGNSISLHYASRPDGPWEVIVSGYKNEGMYRWSLPTGLSGPVYLRLEAIDRAGNIGRAEVPTPVALESGKQRVKVLGVGPAN